MTPQIYLMTTWLVPAPSLGTTDLSAANDDDDDLAEEFALWALRVSKYNKSLLL